MKKIQLNAEQTRKFLMCFYEDAKRLANERKQKEKENKEEKAG
ncbi:hypothetical protein [Cytobacillus spongiae]|nr:hypothetical protein [Cytobacillus spongiae]